MKIKNEKGVINIDYATAIIIFVIGTIAILSLYFNVYKMMVKIKVDEAIIGYITEICETIDLENYENVDSKAEVDSIIQRAKIPEQYTVECENIIKYVNDDDSTAQDVVERINLKITYTVDNFTRDYTISKMKVKE